MAMPKPGYMGKEFMSRWDERNIKRKEIKMIYDEETGMYFQNEYDLKNYRGARESLRNQKPISREEVIAQVQRIKAASQHNKK